MDEKSVSKILFYVSLKNVAKSETNLVVELAKSNNIDLLGICKGLIMRGDNLGFKTLTTLYKENHADKDFSEKFAERIIKEPSKFITKDNGFQFLNKMYSQRLFTTLFPIVKSTGNSHQMMQVCSLVSL